MLFAGVAAAQQIEMTIQAVKDIANQTMGELETRASDSRTKFQALDLPARAFGEVPLGLALARHHDAAHQVFLETINGVVKDLEDFAQKLRDTASSNEARDEEVETALVALGNRYQDHNFQADENYDRTVVAQGGSPAETDAAPPSDETFDTGTGDTTSPDESATGVQAPTGAAPMA